MKSVSASSSNVSASKSNFGEFVRNTRLDLGLSLREFATKLNLSPAFISKMENYHERAGHYDSNDFKTMKANNHAWQDTKNLFTENENITNEEVLSRVLSFLREFIYK